MKVQADGDLQIASGEVVTVTVTATHTHYLAIFGDLQRAEWTLVEPVHPVSPTATEETRSFTAGVAGVEAFSLTLDFVRSREGTVHPLARYVIQVQGSLDPLTITKFILPIPPFPIARPFIFEVVP
jgi:hypothetical protein